MPERPEINDAENPTPADGYANAARAASLAEAGYLASVLESEGINAVVRHTKSFSAINGAWLTDYVIQAPEEQLPRVVAVLRAEAALMNEEGDAADEDDGEVFQQVVWRPFALMAVAGVVSFLAGQHLASAPRETPRGLADAVDRIGEPLYTQSGPGGPRHRLYYDRRNATWLLDTDRNGDGRYDERASFSTGRAVAER